MISTSRKLLVGASLLLIVSSAQAVVVDLPSFGAYAQGQDLEPRANFEDGGPDTPSASVSFDTFAAEAMYDPDSTYLPILRAQANGLGSTSTDDRTFAQAEAYEIFTSSVAQTIDLRITLDSTVFAIPPLSTGGAIPNADASLDVYVFLDPFFATSFSDCPGGVRMATGFRICGDNSGVVSSEKPGLRRSDIANLSKEEGNGTLTQTDTLTFSVAAGQDFGVYAHLSTGAFQGNADAFNTATLEYLALSSNSNIAAISPPGELPPLVGRPSEIPLPAAVWMFGAGLIGLFGLARKKTKT